MHCLQHLIVPLKSGVFRSPLLGNPLVQVFVAEDIYNWPYGISKGFLQKEAPPHPPPQMANLQKAWCIFPYITVSWNCRARISSLSCSRATQTSLADFLASVSPTNLAYQSASHRSIRRVILAWISFSC